MKNRLAPCSWGAGHPDPRAHHCTQGRARRAAELPVPPDLDAIRIAVAPCECHDVGERIESRSVPMRRQRLQPAVRRAHHRHQPGEHRGPHREVGANREPDVRGDRLPPHRSSPSHAATMAAVSIREVEVLGAPACAKVAAFTGGGAGLTDVCSCASAGSAPVGCSVTDASAGTFAVSPNTCAATSCPAY